MNKKIEEILKTYEGDDTNLCYYVFNILKESETPGNDLKFFIEKVKIQDLDSDSTYILEKIFSTNELQWLDSTYGKYINELLFMIVNKAHSSNWDIEKFYNVLWEKIDANIFFEDEKIKEFALFKITQNSLMPYVEIGTSLLMDNKEFSDIIKKDKNIIIKIKHILSLNFTQKTEVASLILNEIQKVESFKEQSVILAIALDDFTQKTMKDLTQMLGNADIKIKKTNN